MIRPQSRVDVPSSVSAMIVLPSSIITMNDNQPDANAAPRNPTLPEIDQAEALANDLRSILVRSENALVKGDAKELVERLERWIESYRRGLSAAQKICDNGPEMLIKTREQLSLSLSELLRLEDEGGNPPNPSTSPNQPSESEEITRAIQRIDRLLPVVEQSFGVNETSRKAV